MKNVRNIYLVRHGESAGNVDKSVHLTHADHAIPLSPRGVEQAHRAGQALMKHLYRSSVASSINWEAASRLFTLSPPQEPYELFGLHRMWVSPYLRTRQTADGVEAGMRAATLPSYLLLMDRRENIALCEQQFGLFDGIPDEELAVRFPNEHAHYKKQEEFEGRFWARMPLGESRWDVAMRVHQCFGTWVRDAERHDIRDLIVVSHGVTLRAITMRWLHLPYEWMDAEPNPKNCSIRRICDGKDMGYIYEGE